ncbi:aminotransferase [Stenotrophomonas phage Summit]|nr:aminotransferase [Stenotrophomonas phage Summit]
MQIVTSLRNPQRQGQIHSLIQEVMNSGAYAEGPKLKEFESILSEHHRMYFATATNSCGSALFAVFSYLKSKGAETVAIQNNTFYATAAMALAAGLKVALVDNRKDCPSMSVDSLRALHSQAKIDAVVLTHVGGYLAKDYSQIGEFCEFEAIPLIEDGAHSYGVRARDLTAGSLGLATTLSFYPTKSIPIGEGGAVITRDPELDQYVRRFISYGKHVEDGVMKYDGIGFNFRMSEVQAAVGIVQLQAVDQIIGGRDRDAKVLAQFMAPLLEGPTNWYKYIVPKAVGFKTVGAVYTETDQITGTGLEVQTPVPLDNSKKWAASHMCLPLGEGMYDGLSKEEVSNYLKGEA